MSVRSMLLAAAMLAWVGPIVDAHEEKSGPLSAADYKAYGRRFAGTYRVIGQLPKSGEAYAGKVVLVANGREFKATRTVAGKTTEGRAYVDVDPVGTHILVMEFTQDGHRYEGTYLFLTTFDSWSRFTGHVAEPGHSRDDSPEDGVEALFPPDDPACGIDA